MKRSQLKELIREEIISLLQEETTTKEPITKPKPNTSPDTDTKPRPPQRRRKLTPSTTPEEAPKKRPAKAYFTEAMIDKIIQRYEKGKKQ